MKKLTRLTLLALLFGALPPRHSRAQGAIPFAINNNSPFADADLYMAIVDLNPSNNHVWINAANNQVLPMSIRYNTVTGPTTNGNTGPGKVQGYLLPLS